MKLTGIHIIPKSSKHHYFPFLSPKGFESSHHSIMFARPDWSQPSFEMQSRKAPDHRTILFPPENQSCCRSHSFLYAAEESPADEKPAHG